MTPDEALARVLAEPDDDALRLVLADLLIDVGDPRGELIALQVEMARGTTGAKAARRVQQLIRGHSAKLLGPLAEVLDPRQLDFRLGFVHGGVVSKRVSRNAMDRVRDSPLARTLRVLAGPGEIVGDPAFELHHANITDDDAHSLLSRRHARALRRLACALPTSAERRALDEAHLPALSSLTVTRFVPDQCGKIAGLRLMRQLGRLGFETDVASRRVPDLLRLQPRFGALPVVQFTYRDPDRPAWATLRLERPPPARWPQATLEVGFAGDARDGDDDLVAWAADAHRKTRTLGASIKTEVINGEGAQRASLEAALQSPHVPGRRRRR